MQTSDSIVIIPTYNEKENNRKYHPCSFRFREMFSYSDC